ncbi:MAG: flagellar hook-basal body complex protein FliE [Planctomycetaceae bacterium]|nr:flagellar hook-basal body complex protein FliE [Planctomycetaceae bacterium]
MTLPVSSIQSAASPLAPPGSTSVGKSGHQLPFADLVRSLVNETNNRQADVGESLKQLVTGETDSVHDVVLTASQADLAFRLVMEIRDRLIASYQEVMRMQV